MSEHKNYKFFVSRQRPYYQNGVLQVEVAQGGIDYSGSDMLTTLYNKLGEGEEFVGMSEAVKAAIAIAKQWKKDSGKHINIAVGCTHGMFTELEGTPLTKKLEKSLLEEAKKFDESLPKCDRCGDIIEESWRYCESDETFCSEHCAEMAYASYLKEQDEFIEAELGD